MLPRASCIVLRLVFIELRNWWCALVLEVRTVRCIDITKARNTMRFVFVAVTERCARQSKVYDRNSSFRQELPVKSEWRATRSVKSNAILFPDLQNCGIFRHSSIKITLSFDKKNLSFLFLTFTILNLIKDY